MISLCFREPGQCVTMVYIASDGRVLQAKPWGLHTITDFLWGIVVFFQMFFKTLIEIGRAHV